MSKGAHHHCYHQYISIVCDRRGGSAESKCHCSSLTAGCSSNGGPLRFIPHLPDSIQVLNINNCQTVSRSSTYPTTARQYPGPQRIQQLPDSIQVLNVSNNCQTYPGPQHQQLPDSIQVLNVSNNCQTVSRSSTYPTTARQYPGPQRIQQLPDSIQVLNVSNNL